MTPGSAGDNVQRGYAIWLPSGFVVGAALGTYLNQPGLGMSLGMLAGATISMAIEYQRGTRSVIWPIIGGFSFLWIAVLFLIERT